MKIYTNGCSFTYGDELTDPINSAWPALLASKYKAELCNDAVSGGTNYRTVYRTIKHLQQNFDLYVIAWTTHTRFTFYKSDNNFEINFNPELKSNLYGDKSFFKDWGKTLYTEWYNELYAFKLWLQQIIQLQSVLGSRNYLMINTMNNNTNLWFADQNHFIGAIKQLIKFDIMNDDQIVDEYKEIQYYKSLINTDKFYQWTKFRISDLSKSFSVGPGGHILEDGHKHLAELLYNHLCLK